MLKRNVLRAERRAENQQRTRRTRGWAAGALVLAAAVFAGVLLANVGSGHGSAVASSAPPTVFQPHYWGLRKVEASNHYCDGCKPPLRYHGGEVLNAGVTVRPIYWEPPTGALPFPAGYTTVINGYIANVSAAGRAQTNVYSIAGEYYETDGKKKYKITHEVTAGPALIDTDPLPPKGCKVSSDETNGPLQSCVTDQQLTAELRSFLSRNHLPAGTGNFYPVFFPPGVETTDGDGGFSVSTFCGYHSFTETSPIILYSNEPFIEDCGGGQSPNGIPSADTAIDTLSHEISETLTDPVVSAWKDPIGDEIGDICAEDYGQPLGSTNPADPQSSEYNQVINGGHYYTQTEFSNYAWSHFGPGYGCQHSEAGAKSRSVQAAEPVDLHSEVYPTTLPADGHSKATVSLSVDLAGSPAAKDQITFTSRTLSGEGTCGTLTSRTARTDSLGEASTSYAASTSDIVCEITATDAQNGKSVSSIVYQGTERREAPTASGTFPHVVQAGRAATFKVTYVNPSNTEIDHVQVVFDAFRGSSHAPTVNADQIRLAYSLDGKHFASIPLGGATTATGGSVSGAIGPASGLAVPAVSAKTVTFRIEISKGVKLQHQPLLALEAYLDQINPATSSAAVLVDTSATRLSVR